MRSLTFALMLVTLLAGTASPATDRKLKHGKCVKKGHKKHPHKRSS